MTHAHLESMLHEKKTHNNLDVLEVITILKFGWKLWVPTERGKGTQSGKALSPPSFFMYTDDFLRYKIPTKIDINSSGIEIHHKLFEEVVIEVTLDKRYSLFYGEDTMRKDWSAGKAVAEQIKRYVDNVGHCQVTLRYQDGYMDRMKWSPTLDWDQESCLVSEFMEAHCKEVEYRRMLFINSSGWVPSENNNIIKYKCDCGVEVDTYEQMRTHVQHIHNIKPLV